MKNYLLSTMVFLFLTPLIGQTPLTISPTTDCGCESACAMAGICTQDTGNCPGGLRTGNANVNVPTGSYLVISSGSCSSQTFDSTPLSEGFSISGGGFSDESKTGQCYFNNTGSAANISITVTANRADEYIEYQVTATNPGGCTNLPVELGAFVGKATENGDQSLLNWSTISELNNAYFSVEYSIDGINFSEIAQIVGAGTTQEQQDYQFVHQSPKEGANYYRLTQVDFDGTFDRSEIVVVQIGQLNFSGATLSHKLVDDYTILRLEEAPAQQASIEIYNISGQFVSRHFLAAGSTEQYLWLNTLDQGHYVMQIKLDNRIETLRFVKY